MTTDRHPFSPISDSPYCAYVRSVGDDSVCGETERAPVHLSDDIVDDRRVPFDRAAPSRDVLAEQSDVLFALERAAGEPCHRSDYGWAGTCETDGGHDGHYKCARCLARQVLAAQHNQESGKEAKTSPTVPVEFESQLTGQSANVEYVRLDAVLAAFPTSWLDNLLTGPDAVIGKGPWGCPDIERLLAAIKKRITQDTESSEASNSPNG